MSWRLDGLLKAGLRGTPDIHPIQMVATASQKAGGHIHFKERRKDRMGVMSVGSVYLIR